jgi:hypothetical protein
MRWLRALRRPGLRAARGGRGRTQRRQRSARLRGGRGRAQRRQRSARLRGQSRRARGGLCAALCRHALRQPALRRCCLDRRSRRGAVVVAACAAAAGGASASWARGHAAMRARCYVARLRHPSAGERTRAALVPAAGRRFADRRPAAHCAPAARAAAGPPDESCASLLPPISVCSTSAGWRTPAAERRMAELQAAAGAQAGGFAGRGTGAGWRARSSELKSTATRGRHFGVQTAFLPTSLRRRALRAVPCACGGACCSALKCRRVLAATSASARHLPWGVRTRCCCVLRAAEHHAGRS